MKFLKFASGLAFLTFLMLYLRKDKQLPSRIVESDEIFEPELTID